MKSEQSSIKLVVFGDLQADRWQEGERPKRVDDFINAIHKVYDIVNDVNADMVVYLGDLFERKDRLHTDVLTKVVATFTDCITHAGCPTQLVAGNHDLYRSGNILDIFNDVQNAEVVTQPASIVYKGYNLLFVPNGTVLSNEQECSSIDYDIAFMHAEIRGATLAKGIQSHTSSFGGKLTGDVSFARKTGRRKLILNGHYHIPQTIQWKSLWKCVPIICVGAPLCHSWSDEGDLSNRGCVIVTMTKENVATDRVAFDFPKFLPEGHKAIRPGIDFTRPTLDNTKVKSKVDRKGLEAVLSSDKAESLRAWLKVTYPGLAKDKDWIERIVQQGAKLMIT
jgi:DNA repair exonuclease SbcCD nuclease subunit